MAELADAQDLGSCIRKDVSVRPRLRPPSNDIRPFFAQAIHCRHGKVGRRHGPGQARKAVHSLDVNANSSYDAAHFI